MSLPAWFRARLSRARTSVRAPLVATSLLLVPLLAALGFAKAGVAVHWPLRAAAAAAGDTVPVFGPHRFVAAGAQAQLGVERFTTESLPGARHLLKVANDGASTAEIRVNGAVVVSRQEFTRARGTLVRSLTLQGQVTIEASVTGPAGTGIVVTVVREPDPTFVVFGTRRFDRTAGAPVTETARFTAPADGGPPYVLHVQNGDPDGSGRVSSAVVTLNGATVFGPEDFDPAIGTLQQDVALAPDNEISVRLASAPGSHLTVWVTATDTAPPVLRISTPAPGLVTNRSELAVTGTVQDRTLTRVTVNGAEAARQGDAFSETVALTAEGDNPIHVSAVDAGGNRTDSVRTVIRDTERPVLTISIPETGVVTREPTLAVSGTVHDRTAVTVNVNGIPVRPDAQGAFAADVPLTEGAGFVTVSATDAAGNNISLTRPVTLDTQPPAITITEPAEGAVTDGDSVAVRGSVADVTPVQVTVNGAAVTVSPTGTFGAGVALQVGANTITVSATDGAGNTATATRSVTRLPAGPVVPPDPATVAPAVSQTGIVTVGQATAFLYSGGSPIQTGVQAGAIDVVRAAVVRGRVLGRDGQPLAGVRVSIDGHPELGQTLSRADGMYDLAVNGGGRVSVDFARDGFLGVQRTVDVPWRDYARLDDVVLSALDAQVTRIEMDPAGTDAQVARGSVVSDASGTRQGTLVFPAGTGASLELPDGSTRPVGSLAVRVTEYTTGPKGPQAMPGALPAATAYTYAAELSADEALQAGASHVRFTKPVAYYLEDFLRFPAGMALPLATYDPSCGCWIPEKDGRVVTILSVSGGLAVLDVSGGGAPAGAAELAALGIDDAERARLAATYQPGESLWRVALTHFSAIDINLPQQPECGAGGRSNGTSACGDQPPTPPEKKDKAPDQKDCKQAGSSYVGCQSQSLGEDIALVGTPFHLVYSSARVPGHVVSRMLTIPLTDSAVSPGLKRVELTVDVAGRRFAETFEPRPNQATEFTWDGLDAYGRTVQGAQSATVRVGYVYEGVYQVPPARAASFGLPSGVPGTIPTRQEITETRVAVLDVGSIGSPAQGVGGWSLDAQHLYDPNARVLFLGDGSRSSADVVRASVSVVAGSGAYGLSGDGGPATQATMAYPRKLAFGPDGSLYITDNSNARVRRVKDGVITTFAGGGTVLGDGGPANQARLVGPSGIAVGPDGSVYISDSGDRRVRKVTPDGIIHTIAGTGASGLTGDGGPATLARLQAPHAIAVGPDCSVYIAEITGNRVRRIGPDGIITTVVGTGVNGASGDGGPAVQATIGSPLSVAVGADGALYVADYAGSFQPGRIRRVGTDGIITTVAGGGYQAPQDGMKATDVRLYVPGGMTVAPDGTLYISEQGGGQFSNFIPGNKVWRVSPEGVISLFAGDGTYCPYQAGVRTCGDGQAPTEAQVSEPYAIAVGPDAAVYVTERSNHLVRRIAPPLPGFTGGSLLVAGDGGSEVYEVDLAGRHLRTLDALSGATRFTFGYDAAGRVVRATDMDGQTTTIERAADGTPLAVVAPHGQRTVLGVNAQGFLDRVTNPAGETWRVSYRGDGMVSGFTDPRGRSSAYVHDSIGRITRATDPEGGYKTVSRTDFAGGYEVVVRTASGRETRYRVQDLPGGGSQRTTVTPSGDSIVAVNQGGRASLTASDGTRIDLVMGGDPRFGMQAPRLKQVTARTPGGLTRTVTDSFAVALSNRADPLSVTGATRLTAINGRIYTWAYDRAAATTTTTTPAGRRVVRSLDAQGRITGIASSADIDPASITYDAEGRVTRLAEGPWSHSVIYDGTGRVSAEVGAVGDTTRYRYDGAGRITDLFSPGGRRFQYGYDSTGSVTRVVMPSGAVHAIGYNGVHLPTTYSPPGNPSLSRAYNLDRDVERVTLPGGRQVASSYDAAGRPTGTTFPEAAVQFTYADGTRRVRTIRRTPAGGGAGQDITYDYDGSLPTHVSFSGAANGEYAYRYDDNLFLAGMSLDGADETTVRRDADGQLTGLGSFDFGRGGPNGMTDQVGDGTMEVRLAYDRSGRISRRTHVVAGRTVYELEMTRDAAHRVTERRETVGGVTHVFGYAYGRDGELLSVTRDGQPAERYTYDDDGNRLTSEVNGQALAASFDAQDRLQAVGAVPYVFDTDGFMTQRGLARFQYSARGELLRATLSDGTPVTYAYDGLGRRVARTDGAGTVQYLYGNPGNAYQVTASRSASGELTQYFYDEAGMLFAFDRAGARFYVATDQVGTPRVVSDAAGNVVKEVAYDTWGNRLSDSAPAFELAIGWAGGLADAATGLVRFGFRDYDPLSGRWTARDPLLFAAGQANLFAYAGNDPVNHRDPSGLLCIGIEGFAGIGASAKLCIDGKGVTSCVGVGIGVGGGVEVNTGGSEENAGLSATAGVKIEAKCAGFGASASIDIDLNTGCGKAQVCGTAVLVKGCIDSSGKSCVTNTGGGFSSGACWNDADGTPKGKAKYSHEVGDQNEGLELTGGCKATAEGTLETCGTLKF